MPLASTDVEAAARCRILTLTILSTRVEIRHVWRLPCSRINTHQRRVCERSMNPPRGEIRMSAKNKIAGFLIATALAAFALPAAAQKVYTLNLSPTSLNAGASGVALTATMNNISPDTGNSSVKSFKLFAPVGGGITITGPASGNVVALG